VGQVFADLLDLLTRSMSFNSASEKRQYVNTMFARIAYRYDLMNRVMTGGQDVRWRRLMVHAAALPPGGRFLDVATGTGDVAFEALRQQPGLALVVGADFTLLMMQVGQMRAAGRPVRWTGADTLSLPYPNDTFDAVASGFLMRNVTDVAGTLAEQRRVTRSGGRVLVLDVPRPPDTLWGELFRFYFHQIVPRLGGLISGQPDAYAYLPRSADAFMRPDELAAAMESVGLCQVHYQMLMLGTVALHVGLK
jgi:demethylmenaquinone methyltransferase/2-methoxy-6-polyprenyl-1,4-benzoquinol methylase